MAESQLIGGPISEDKLMRGILNAGKMMNKVATSKPSAEKMKSFIEKQESYSQQPIDETYLDPNKIQNSRLAEPIKKAMMGTKVPTLNEGLKMDFNSVAEQIKQTRQISNSSQNSGVSLIESEGLLNLIENTIRKVLDEKLNQILSALNQTTINEELILRVGDSTFRGKITGIVKPKKK